MPMKEDRTEVQRPKILPVVLGRIALAGLLGLAILSGLVWAGTVSIPSRLNPFAPLRIADDINWLTRMKLFRLQSDRLMCRAVLEGASLDYRPVPDQALDEGCGLSNAVEVTEAAVAFSRSFTATCQLTVAWALFETHVMMPAARRYFDQAVAQVIHLGTYACRNINHRADGRRSEHAIANAIDISGFVLTDGQRITLKDDWSGADPRKAAFLKTVRDGACEIFNVVLSPDYNEAHRDHFHFDMGRHRACR